MSADLFARVRKPCTSPYDCGRIVHTLAKVEHPVCHACRRRLRNLRRQPYRQAAERRETARSRRDYWRGYYVGRKAARTEATHA